MPRYTYTAKSSPTQIIQSNIEAESEQEVIDKLAKSGLFPVAIKLSGEITGAKQSGFGLRKISGKEVVVFTRQLSSLIEAGLNILRSLNIVLEQTSNKYMRALLADVVAKVKEGKPISEALEAYPQIFPGLYTSIIRAGEASGTIEQSLKILADFLEKEMEFKNSIRAALVYPLFVAGVGVLTVVLLLTFVVPRLTSLFTEMSQQLPLPTKILMAVSNSLRSGWWLMLIVSIAAVFILRKLLQRPKTRLAWDRLKLKIAVFGEITAKTEISRLSRTLSILLSNGIPIVSSLEICSTVLENESLRNELKGFKEKINAGSSLSACLKGSKTFPDFAINILSVGEETGNLEKSLLHIANTYETEVDRSLKAVTRMVEPVIILGMGLVVGLIVLSILMPIFQLNLIIK